MTDKYYKSFTLRKTASKSFQYRMKSICSLLFFVVGWKGKLVGFGLVGWQAPLIIKIARRTTRAKGYYFLATFLQASNKSLERL